MLGQDTVAGLARELYAGDRFLVAYGPLGSIGLRFV